MRPLFISFRLFPRNRHARRHQCIQSKVSKPRLLLVRPPSTSFKLFSCTISTCAMFQV